MDQFLPMELKEVGDDGTFKGIASVYGVEDLQGDVIDKGAFTKTISENAVIPILWQHQSGEVIGEGTVKEWQGKVLVEGKLDIEGDPTAQKAYGKIRRKLIKSLSIGFRTVKSTWEDVEGRMVRHIQELKLYEVSIVTFPALPSAQITRVKSEQQEEIKRLTDQLAKSIERITALEAEVVTLKKEPTLPAEPPPPPEPVEDHSALLADIRKQLEA